MRDATTRIKFLVLIFLAIKYKNRVRGKKIKRKIKLEKTINIYHFL